MRIPRAMWRACVRYRARIVPGKTVSQSVTSGAAALPVRSGGLDPAPPHHTQTPRTLVAPTPEGPADIPSRLRTRPLAVQAKDQFYQARDLLVRRSDLREPG